MPAQAFSAVRAYIQRDLPDAELELCDPAALDQGELRGSVLIPLMVRVDEALLARAPNVRLIHQWGAGVEGVDHAAATARGIAVANAPTTGGNAESVAEWCVMAAIALSRQLAVLQAGAAAGGPWGVPLGRALFGKTAGIVGLGGIGQALARRLAAFGMRVVGVKQRPDAALAERLGLAWMGTPDDLPSLLRQAEYLFLCLPGTPATRGLIGRAQLAMLPPGAILVNAGRGALVEREALWEALESDTLGGVGLDVFWQEPTTPGDPLVAHPRVLATPHVAGVTDVSYDSISQVFAENVRRVVQGHLPFTCTNPAVADRWIRRWRAPS